MKIFQALKKKNYLIKEIKKLQVRIHKHNSILEGNIRPYSMEELVNQMNTHVDDLIDIKASITKANLPVQHKIYRLGELKALIKFYKNMSIKDGRSKVRDDGYGEETAVFSAELKATDIDKKIDDMEWEIQLIHEELDQYNLETDI